MANLPVEEKIGVFQIFLIALSVYVLVILAIEAVVPLSASTHFILAHVDNAICAIFLYDFLQRFLRAPRKLRFLRWGWIDLVSSIPLIPDLRAGRAVRLIRIFRLLRGFRSVETIGKILYRHRTKGALATATFICVLSIVFASIEILQVETDPGSNIHTPGDALWWSIATIFTVGYGDKYPVTAEGRMIGALLMVSGVGLLSVITGSFAAWFLGDRRAQDQLHKQLAAMTVELQNLHAEIQTLQTHQKDSGPAS